MPLPKPSKTISKRIKKSAPLQFYGMEPTLLPSPPRERRVRVICTDPDATDSSSDEEDNTCHSRKRLVTEIRLPASPSSAGEDFSELPVSDPSAMKRSHNYIESEVRKAVSNQKQNSPTETESHLSIFSNEGELATFLSDIFTVEQNGLENVWDLEVFNIGADDMFSDVKVFEQLDSDVLTWIDTLQKVA